MSINIHKNDNNEKISEVYVHPNTEERLVCNEIYINKDGIRSKVFPSDISV